MLPAAANCQSSSVNSVLLLRRRRRLKRNLSANSLGTAAAPGSSSTLGPGTRSLDRKTLLKYRQWVQPQEREWVGGELRRGCLQIYKHHLSRWPQEAGTSNERAKVFSGSVWNLGGHT